MTGMNAYANSTRYTVWNIWGRGRRRIFAVPVGAMIALAVLALSLSACQSAEGGASQPGGGMSLPSEPFLDLPTVLPAERIDRPDAVPEDLSTLWEVWAIVNGQHVDRLEFDQAAFDEAAIRGLISAIGDPHTNYVPPEVFQIENEDIYGSFEGIGANVQMSPDGKLVIGQEIQFRNFA